jgi:hypothetical protein
MAFKAGPQGEYCNHVNVNAHGHGGHFIPWENPGAWVNDLRRTFHDRRPRHPHGLHRYPRARQAGAG